MALGNKKAPANQATKTDTERLAALEQAFTQVVEQNNRMGGMMATLLAGLQPQHQQTSQTNGNGKGSAASALGIDRSKLPNPADDPDKFFEALDAQITNSVATAIGNVSKAVEADQTANKTRQEFWEDMSDRFDRKYDDLSDEKVAPVVTDAAKRVVARLNARGVDPERYAAIDPEGWMAQVAEEARSALAQVASQVGDEDDDAASKGGQEFGKGTDGASGAPITLGAGDDGRADSLAGGDQTNIVANTNADAGKKKQKGPDSLFGELKAFQEKHRLTP